MSQERPVPPVTAMSTTVPHPTRYIRIKGDDVPVFEEEKDTTEEEEDMTLLEGEGEETLRDDRLGGVGESKWGALPPRPGAMEMADMFAVAVLTAEPRFDHFDIPANTGKGATAHNRTLTLPGKPKKAKKSTSMSQKTSPFFETLHLMSRMDEYERQTAGRGGKTPKKKATPKSEDPATYSRMSRSLRDTVLLTLRHTGYLHAENGCVEVLVDVLELYLQRMASTFRSTTQTGDLIKPGDMSDTVGRVLAAIEVPNVQALADFNQRLLVKQRKLLRQVPEQVRTRVRTFREPPPAPEEVIDLEEEEDSQGEEIIVANPKEEDDAHSESLPSRPKTPSVTAASEATSRRAVLTSLLTTRDRAREVGEAMARTTEAKLATRIGVEKARSIADKLISQLASKLTNRSILERLSRSLEGKEEEEAEKETFTGLIQQLYKEVTDEAVARDKEMKARKAGEILARMLATRKTDDGPEDEVCPGDLLTVVEEDSLVSAPETTTDEERRAAREETSRRTKSAVRQTIEAKRAKAAQVAAEQATLTNTNTDQSLEDGLSQDGDGESSEAGPDAEESLGTVRLATGADQSLAATRSRRQSRRSFS